MKRSDVGLPALVVLATAYAPVHSVLASGVAAVWRELAEKGQAPSWAYALSHFGTVLRKGGMDAVLTYFAGDAFYYMNVAHRSLGVAGYTYDGQLPTNGFHPLWQYGLTAAFQCLGGDREAELLMAFAFNVVAVAAGAGLCAAAFMRVTKSHALTLLAIVPGLYHVVFAPDQRFNAMWSNVNGMESSLSILLFGALAYALLARQVLRRYPTRGIVLISCLLTLITLSRLDDIMWFVPFLLLVLVSAASPADAAKKLGAAVVVPTIAIGSYLLYNLSYSGLALPVSAMVKDHVAIGDNFRTLVRALSPLGDAAFSLSAEGQALTWRSIQMAVPLVMAALWLATRRWRVEADRDAHVEQMLVMCSVYVILKGTYNFVNVPAWSQGYWYFPVNLILTNLFMALMLRRLWPARSELPQGQPWRTAAALLLACVFVALRASSFVGLLSTTDYSRRKLLWERKQTITQEIAKVYDGNGLLELADGIIGYSLTIPTMGGLGFTLDKAAAQAKQRGELLRVAYQRGYRAFASLYYFGLPAELDGDVARVQAASETFFPFWGQHPEQWRFRVIFRDPASQLVVVAFAPK